MRLISAFMISSILALPAATFAAPVTYNVDSTQSSLTASGTFTFGSNTSAIAAQSPGSLVTSYSGTINADLDFGLNSVQFTGGTLTAANSGSYLPGGTPGNYGTVTTQFVNPILFTIDGAVRNFSFSPTSGVITGPASFNANQLLGTILSGELDYITSPFGPAGSPNITGSLVFTSGTATIVDGVGVETLTVPIHTTLTIDPLNPLVTSPNSLSMQLDGQIVATRDLPIVPEPATLGVLGIGAGMLLLKRRRVTT
jgi:hypothetical protein